MERELKAFFYEYKYYLFPEEYQTLGELKELSTVRAKRLKEDGCMAPDFIYESMEEEVLEIENPNRLFEVSVNLYSREEYDEILTGQVELRCPSCARYVRDDKPLDLSGHHREMSLNGVCYEREDKDEAWSFSMCVECFWYRMGKRITDLALYIDKNKQKKLNKLLNDELTHFCFPVEFYGAKRDGQYHLYISSGMDLSPLVVNVISFIAAMGNVEDSFFKRAGWQVHSFIPAGVKKYDGKVSFRDKDCKVYLAPTQDPATSIVRFQHPKADKFSEKKREKIFVALNAYMNAELGEEVANAVIDGYEIINDNEKTIPMSELKQKLSENYQEFFVSPTGEKAPYPALCTYCRNEEDETTDWWLPYKNYVREGATGCPEMTFLERKEVQGQKPWWMSMLSYVYFYVPRAIDGPENAYETLGWYLQNCNLVPEPLRNPEDTRLSAAGIGVADCAERGFIMENIVMDEKKFFRMMRILAPVLRSYDVKAVVVNKDGATAYACDYEFTPVEF